MAQELKGIVGQRYIWLDWMKVIGMYLIICGHLWVPNYLQIYVFSVPAFYIISGFLHKNDDDVSFYNILSLVSNKI